MIRVVDNQNVTDMNNWQESRIEAFKRVLKDQAIEIAALTLMNEQLLYDNKILISENLELQNEIERKR